MPASTIVAATAAALGLCGIGGIVRHCRSRPCGPLRQLCRRRNPVVAGMGLGDTAAVKDLVTLPRSNLRDRAREAGATDGQVEKADADEHDPKAALAKLIILHRRIQQSPPPPYWTETAGTFHNVVRSAYVQSMAHDLLNKTAVDKGTADRKKLGKPPPPGGFEIVAAQRIENSAMWERYAKKMVEMRT